MKTIGIVLIALGILGTIGTLVALSKGYRTSFGGVGLIVLGAFLISRAEKKKDEEEKKKRWSEGNSE